METSTSGAKNTENSLEKKSSLVFAKIVSKMKGQRHSGNLQMLKRISYSILRIIVDGAILFGVGLVFFLFETYSGSSSGLSAPSTQEAFNKSASTLYIYFIGFAVIIAYVLCPTIFGVRRWVGYFLAVIPLLFGIGFYLSARINSLPNMGDWLILSAIATFLLLLSDTLCVRRLISSS